MSPLRTMGDKIAELNAAKLAQERRDATDQRDSDRARKAKQKNKQNNRSKAQKYLDDSTEEEEEEEDDDDEAAKAVVEDDGYADLMRENELREANGGEIDILLQEDGMSRLV